jgi:outer membrane autotransporter protein
VTNFIESNGEDANGDKILQTTRAAGDPTGLELAFDRQRRTSLQSELQLVAGLRIDAGAGSFVPRVSASWLHEFKGQRELVGVRMAQDRRADPARFAFTTDSTDKNKGTIALGLSFVQGAQFSADVEVSRLVGDDRFDSTQVALQALWRF